MAEYRVVLSAPPWLDQLQLIIWKEEHGKLYYAKIIKGAFKWIETKPEQIAEPAISHGDRRLWTKIVEAISTQGIKIPHSAQIQGELDATKRHLADMRELTFKRRDWKG